MTWDEIRELYLSACSDSEDAHKQQYLHLNFSHRQVSAALNLPELYMENDSNATTDGEDYITTPTDLFSVESLVNQDDGRKMDPEPNGWRGRVRFYEAGETRPPKSNSPQFYIRKGSKIYLRDCPNSDEPTLLLSYRAHPTEIDEDDLSTSPVPPEQYHMAMAQVAAGNYYRLHPPQLPGGQRDLGYGKSMMEDAMQDIGTQKQPKAEEKLDHRKYVVVPGYTFSP